MNQDDRTEAHDGAQPKDAEKTQGNGRPALMPEIFTDAEEAAAWIRKNLVMKCQKQEDGKNC